MSLDFKILWFDDQSITAHKRIIESILKRDYCLNLSVSNKKGNEDLSNTDYDKFDLILMDYGLIGSESGVEKYKEIRAAHSYVDVAFYSTTMEECREKLKELEKSGFDVEGAYYLDYQNDTLFEEKIEHIIDKIVKRSESIENLRGLILSETTLFDKRAYEIIERLTTKYNLLDELNDYISKEIHENIIKKYNLREGEYASADSKFEYCMDPTKSIPYLDAANQIRLLNRILKILKAKGINVDNKLDKFFENYRKEVIDYRNAFAHRLQKENKITINGNEIIIDCTFHKFIRKQLHKYGELFLLIEKL